MASKFYDYVYVDNQFKGEYGDFSGGENAFSATQKINFLENYANFLEEKNDIFKTPQKAVTCDEVANVEKKINYELLRKVRKRVVLNQFRLATEEYDSGFENWKLYAGARVDEGIIYLEDKNIPPVANAKYCFAEGAKEIAFSVYFADTFYNKAKKNGRKTKVITTTQGRVIELRNGIKEILKLQFYANGEAYVRIGKPDFYHSEDFYVSDFRINAWNSVKITLRESTFELTLNGEKCDKEFEYTTSCSPDTLFLSGGMHPRDTWRVKMEKLTYSDKEVCQFFKKSDNKKIVSDSGKQVDLPYCLGLKENKDKTIVLQKTINYQGGILRLHVGTIDPCGEIYVNDTKVATVNSFLCEEIDITNYVEIGENSLVIKVFPRAPEVPYPWHRHQDPYNGWFCRDVYLDYLSNTSVEDLEVTTQSVEKEVTATVSFHVANYKKGTQAFVYLAKTYPDKGQETLLFSGNLEKARFEKTFCFKADLWDVENPNLYSVRVELSEKGTAIDDEIIETGFRTIAQKDGNLYLNNKKIALFGGLIMQFLPPYENIPCNHVCPTYPEVIAEMLSVKKMNGNTARLHMLGYGTNDKKIASICDRLGLMLIWTTRLIDGLETMEISDKWKQRDEYIRQMSEVINNPSIIMWEGSNEYHASAFDFDSVFDEFVDTVRSRDNTRLICPVSHVYYGAEMGDEGFYYQDDGEYDLYFEKKSSSYGWKDDLVVRSAHTYAFLLGYGRDWTSFREQKWSAQDALFESKKHAYIISEFAVIGRQDPSTPECAKYIKTDSYELANEQTVFGDAYPFLDAKKSQAYQALCARNAVKFMRFRGTDGLLWCAMQGGANDGSYLKPPIDFYGYVKYAFFALKEGFAKTVCFNGKIDVRIGAKYQLEPFICGMEQGKNYKITITVRDVWGFEVLSKTYDNVYSEKEEMHLKAWTIDGLKDGYYSIEYAVDEITEL